MKNDKKVSWFDRNEIPLLLVFLVMTIVVVVATS